MKPSPIPPTPIPLIIGPTAGGKSALAMALARTLRERGLVAEVISADAYQVYRGMDIGTAKPSEADRAEFAHHLIDLSEPTESFTVHDWLRHAQGAIDQIREHGGVPIVVGGTHLYAKALTDGLFEGPKPDPELRARLDALDGPTLRTRLAAVDPQAAERIHPNDRRRTVRALEVFEQTGTPISALQQQWDANTHRDDLTLCAIDWPVEAINRRINARVRQMVSDGLVEEARGLWEGDCLGPTAREALGYKQLIPHFQGRLKLDDALEQIKIETRRFAKKQRTWIRRLSVFPGSVRLSGDTIESPEDLQTSIQQILRSLFPSP